MRRPVCLLLLCGLGVLLGSVGCTPKASDPKELKAKDLIRDQAKTIVRAAHPLGKFTTLTCEDSTKTAGGYDQTFTLGWTGVEKKEFHTTLVFGFDFDPHGDITKVRITVKGDSSSVEPFELNQLAVAGLRVLLKGQLKELLGGELAKELSREVDEIGDARDLLAFWLKHVGNKKA